MVNNLKAFSPEAMEFNGFSSREARGGPEDRDYPTDHLERPHTRDGRDRQIAAAQQGAPTPNRPEVVANDTSTDSSENPHELPVEFLDLVVHRFGEHP